MPSIIVGLGALQLPAFEVGTSLILRAAPGNAGVVHFGYAATVTAVTAGAVGDVALTDGIPLSAGQSIELTPKRCGATSSPAGLPITSSSAIFVIATAVTQRLYFDAR